MHHPSKRCIAGLAGFVVAATLGACASRPPVVADRPAPVWGTAPAQGAYGVVTGVDRVAARNNNSGAGALAGGVAGAVVGRQFGDSSNSRAMGTFIGAIAGALVGNEVEAQQSGAGDVVRITVALDRGGERQFDYRDAGGLRVGDRVRVADGRLIPVR